MKLKPVILVVDDVPQNIELLEAYLAPEGYEIVTAANGEEALGKISVNQIDLILLDVMMPGIDGFEVIRRIRQDDTHRLLPIIMVTSLHEREDRVKGIEAGCDDFISKPVDKVELLARVRSLLKVKAYNDLLRNYQTELESEVALRTSEKAEVMSKLEKSEAFLKATGQMAKVGGWELDAANLDINWTEETCRIHELPLGHKPTLEEAINYYHPDERRKLLDSIQRALKYGETFDMEMRFISAKGNHLWVRAICFPQAVDGKIVRLKGTFQDITDRKLVEQGMRESEERYRALYDSSLNLVYIMDFEGRFIDANAAALNRLGYTREEIHSLNFASLLSEDQLPLALKGIQEIRETGIQRGMIDFRLRHKNRSDVYVETHGSAVMSNGIPVAIQAIARDITERKLAAEVLKESENKYRLLADNVNDVIFVLDMNLNCTYISPSVKILRGYEPEEVLKLPPADALLPSSKDLAMKLLSDIMELEKKKQIKSDESRTLPLEMKRKDGTTVWTEVKFSFIRDANQQPVGIMGLTRDITERKLAEAKLQQTLYSLKNAISATIQVMVSAVEMKDPYTAGHQLRSADLAMTIATEMGLTQEIIDGIKMAGSIHDIGKLSIPAEILSKPTKLTKIEFSLIKEHVRSGYEMLKDVQSPWPLAQIVYQHHERMDGSGYPRNLKGEEIILEARIMAVADVVEAMASHRPYRPALGIDATLEEIERNRGILYDAPVVDACLRLFREKGYALV